MVNHMTDDETSLTPCCDGHEYEIAREYDLREDFDRHAFSNRLDLFIDWFDDADEVFEYEEDGHRHFIVGRLEVKCNIEKVSDRIRRLYWTIGDPHVKEQIRTSVIEDGDIDE